MDSQRTTGSEPAAPPAAPERAPSREPTGDAEPVDLGAVEAPTPPPDTAELADRAYRAYERAFGDIQAPFAFVDLDAVWANAADMLRRARGKPIRVASKSIRCRAMLDRALDLDPGFQGLLTFTLAETNWLWELGHRDLVCAYPTTDRGELKRLAEITASSPEDAPVVMVDCEEHLDLIEDAAAGTVAPVRVAIDIDAGYRPLGGLISVGPKRSPVRTAEQAVRLAREIERRQRVVLVGAMAYEGQVAGVGDDVPGKAIRNALIRAMQAASMRELRERRAEIVAELMEVAPLEFVNGGGTGSIELTAAEGAVTEVAAGSGFFAPVLFDHYRDFVLTPAAMFALPVVRRPGRGVVTALGGGYLASGVGAKDRMPVPYLPHGLKLDPFEGTGEVQTPLTGEAADLLEVGDRVYMRHIKAGELCERFNTLHLIAGGTIRDEVPTYRGEGRCFL